MTAPSVGLPATDPPPTPPSATKPHRAPPPRDIGQPKAPVRAITFSGGAFDTVMQLGVVHALLVTRAVPPDVVVGVSAGAVNAVALAEVLQAGDTGAQIARFRQILDAYQRAPRDLFDALLPDPFQVEAERPLEPLQLPIHHEREREGRLDALTSRAGMINLYNQLLDLGTSIGTLTRAARVALGLVAAGDLRDRGRKIGTVMSQVLQGWLLLGANLFRLAPVFPPLLTAMVRRKPPGGARGSSAGEIILQWRVILPLRKTVTHGGSLLLLVVAWLVATGLVFLAPAALTHALAWIPVPWLSEHRTAATGVLYGAVAFAVLVVVRAWPPTGLRRALPHAGILVALVVSWALVLLVPAFALHLALKGFAFGLVAQGWWATVRDSWFTGYLALFVLCVAAGVLLVRRLSLVRASTARPFWARLLQQFDLHDALLDSHPLRQLFMRLFDPQYYGGVKLDSAVERALNDDPSPAVGDIKGKSLGAYNAPRVGLTVADVASGTLRILDPDVRVVDGLLAATAMVPLFPPVAINGAVYVDGTNIANEPTRALIDFLRDRVNPDSTVLHVYSVTSLPVSEPHKETIPHQPGLVAVARRALQLQRYRDATLERRLTELYTRTIPGDGILYPTPEEDRDAQKRYVRAWVHPIEPDVPLEVNRSLLAAETGERTRDLVAETVADGCRAALQVMIQPALRDAAASNAVSVACRCAVKRHLHDAEPALLRNENGSVPDGGPGLVEVCAHCALSRTTTPSGARELSGPAMLVVSKGVTRPRWPSRLDPAGALEVPYDQPPWKAAAGSNQPLLPGWPRDHESAPGAQRPLVNLLFSGGVFRGVYQMGVLNALSEVDLQPDVIAGASVGSITAAMVARAFTLPRGPDRERRIASLAATYLALDRLILTDRFADFIRNFTLRAASTRFSLRQADRVFRRYDRPGRGAFNWELRRVAAGLERLLYLSPFELKTLVEAIRERRSHEVIRQVVGHVQEWLDRSGVKNEILGAEPLALLITRHVIDGMSSTGVGPAQVPFDLFLREKGICFFATATNLSQGQLQILGAEQLAADPPIQTLLDGLLASSAFPGVFRPREAWELMPATANPDQFIDGGVIDNLPLDAVAEFLQRAALQGKITPRPQSGGTSVPHLLFSASLETELAHPTPEQLAALQDNWPALFRRTRQLGYNKKLEVFAETQRDLRAIRERSKDAPSPWTPLDLEVVMVRPKWLCGTFAFHPMLGFRRAKQAASIAHGCASTLVQLGELSRTERTAAWARAWGISVRDLPPSDAPAISAALVPRDNGDNKCWFRPDVDCPFSARRLARLKLSPPTALELGAIYHACGRPETHRTQ